MRPLTIPQLRALLDLHEAGGRLPASQIQVGTSRALEVRSLASLADDEVSILPRGRMAVSRALASVLSPRGRS